MVLTCNICYVSESVNCAAFTAGIIEAFLKGSNYVSKIYTRLFVKEKYDIK